MGDASDPPTTIGKLVLVSDLSPHLLCDAEGFLINLADWSPVTAEILAGEVNIKLCPEHWQLIALIQQFYSEFGLTPSMRPLLRYASVKLGADKATSLYFLHLFPNSPAKLLAKIAGLPRPENCL